MRKLSVIIILTLVILPNTHGQSSNELIDSLLQIVNKADKNEKSELYNELSKLSLNSSPLKAIQFAEEALVWAEKQENNYERATSLFNLGSACFALARYNESKDYFHQALVVFSELKETDWIARTFNNLGLVYRELMDFDKAEHYINDAQAIFQDTKNQEGEAQAFNNLGSLYLREKKYDMALTQYLKSLEIRQNSDDKTKLASLYNNIALVYKELDEHSQALDYHERSLSLLTELQDQRELAATYNYIGNIYLKTGVYNKALEAYLNALSIRKELDIKSDIAGTLSNIGLVYLDMNNLKMAEDFFHQALELYDSESNTRMMSVTFNRLGNVYLNAGETKKSLDAFENALQISIELKDDIARSNALKNIGKIYSQTANVKKALEYFKEAIEVNNNIGNINGNTFIFNDIGNLYFEEKKYNDALSNYTQAITAGEKVDNSFIVALCNRKIGEINLLMDNPSQAKPYIEKSLVIAKQLKHYTLIQNAYYTLYEYNKQMNNTDQALDNYIQYSNYKDSINQELNNKRITELQIRTEMEERDDLISTQEEAIKSITLANQKQRTIIISLIVISFLVSMLVLLIWNRFSLKKKTNEMLQKQMKIIEETNEKLLKSETDLRLLNSTKDKFFSIIAHDLKNPIGAILGITELLTKDFDSHPVEAIREYNNLIHDSSKQLFELLQNLLQWARSQTGRIEYKPEVMSLNELLKENINLLKLSAQNKNIKINYSLEQEKVYADKEMLNTVIRNLISNAIKFTHSGGNVEVSSMTIDSHVEVSVKDSGVGMTKDEIRMLFRLDVHHTTMGTFNETGTGLGLILCKEFIERNKGKIWVESEPGKGSCFIFTLPKSTNSKKE
ncbi:MAG: tetratricopeptide repeat-containing sensor histidine kinase [Bacteroidales bacterium]|nr:tetratricopeptide repeat-containing sensor histidine kinase [Bacteroidales bacterium]